MRQISEFPRVELGVLPTPLYKLENLSRETGGAASTSNGTT